MYGELPWRKNLHESLKLSLIWGRRWRRKKMKGISVFEVWEVKKFLFSDPNWGYLKSWEVRARMGCEMTRLPFKIGQKSRN